MVSGGNSSSIYLVDKGELPVGINNLRLGESFLLGNDTAYETKLPGTVSDALILQAQIIELKEKPSLPIGEVGVDAFGEKPYYCLLYTSSDGTRNRPCCLCNFQRKRYLH